MATKNLDQLAEEAIELLPATGQFVGFDDYKAKLYAAMPEAGYSVFSHLIRAELIAKKLVNGSDNKPALVVGRKA